MTDEFKAMVADLKKPGASILDKMTIQKSQLIFAASDIYIQAAKLLEESINMGFSTPHTCDRLHMAVGIAGEAGELLDAIKKGFAYNKPLDRANIVEELGDTLFYIEGFKQAHTTETGALEKIESSMSIIGGILEITKPECLDANLEKLTKGDRARYKGGVYSDEAAQLRADKAE
jgi:NTP pyrophosphatase (non-canonical NTP hydrolase)